MIPQRNLSLLSNRIARDGGRRIPEAVLERDYCIAWFLAGLSGTSLSERLAFKGGTAMKHCYFGDYRFSEDLDFTLVNETGFEAIRREMDGVFAAIRQESAMEFRFARDRARNEPRDLYDIWYLMGGKHVDLAFLKTSIAEKLAFRGRALAGIIDELRAKEDRLRRLWDSRLSHQMALLPEFQEVFRAVQREFRRAGLPEA